MQSKEWIVPFVAAACISVISGILALGFQAGTAAVLLTFLGGCILGFVCPKGAWRWALVLALWVIAATVLKFPTEPPSQWCPFVATPVQAAQSNVWILSVVPFVGVYIGVGADWLVSEALRRLAFLRWRWLEHAKRVLRMAAVALAAFVVLSCGLMLAQPLQPYSLGQTYCWDEFCFAVTSVKRAKVIGTGASRAVAHGMFYIVTADMETPWWGRFYWGNDAVYATDYSGTDYTYSVRGQLASDELRHSRRSQCHLILGAGETETIVFDFPENVVQPRLLIRDTLGIEGLMGGVRSSLFYVKPAFNLRYD